MGIAMTICARLSEHRKRPVDDKAIFVLQHVFLGMTTFAVGPRMCSLQRVRRHAVVIEEGSGAMHIVTTLAVIAEFPLVDILRCMTTHAARFQRLVGLRCVAVAACAGDYTVPSLEWEGRLNVVVEGHVGPRITLKMAGFTCSAQASLVCIVVFVAAGAILTDLQTGQGFPVTSFAGNGGVGTLLCEYRR